MEKTTEHWITLKEAAQHLNVSPSWLYQKGSQAGVPRANLGSKYRYKISDLDDWMVRRGGLPGSPHLATAGTLKTQELAK